MPENKQKWMELCEQAADERDPKKLAALISQINFVLAANELRLGRYRSTCRRELADVGRIALRPFRVAGGGSLRCFTSHPRRGPRTRLLKSEIRVIVIHDVGHPEAGI